MTGPQLTGPQLTIATATDYVAGFPMVVVVSWANPTPDITFTHLPTWSLISDKAALDFLFQDEHGHKVTRSAPTEVRDRAGGVPLTPGESRRMLYDVAPLVAGLPPGRYRVHAIARGKGLVATTAETDFHLTAPSTADAHAAAQLLKPLHQHSWTDFLVANFRTVPSLPLSTPARRALALHHALHRLTYDHTPLEQLDLALLDEIPEWLAPEAGAFRYELLHVRHSPDAARLRALLVSRTPGIAYLLDDVDRDLGFLAGVREAWGATQPFETPPSHWPYGK